MSRLTKTKRHSRIQNVVPDYSALGKQFSENIMRLPEDFDTQLPISEMYRWALSHRSV